jgi:preprotein translocase subunit Sss1
MKLSELLESWKKILSISERPDPSEYKLLFKITVGGILLVGGIGFAIHALLYFLLQGGGGG